MSAKGWQRLAKASLWLLTPIGLVAMLFAFASAQPGKFKLLGPGTYRVLLPGFVVSLPSEEDYIAVAQHRTETIERGETPDERPARNLARNPLVPEPASKKLDRQTGQLYPAAQRLVSVTYRSPTGDSSESERHLLVWAIDTPQGTRVLPDPGSATPMLTPSPDGSQYLFESDDHLWLLSVPSMRVTRLTGVSTNGIRLEDLRARTDGDEFPIYWATNAVWSQDGQLIAYASNRTHPDDPRWTEVWVIDLSQHSEHQVITARNPLRLGGWTEDGRLVLYEYSVDRPAYRIVAASPIPSGDRQVLLEHIPDPNAIALSPAGQGLLYSTSRPFRDLWYLDFATGATRQLAKLVNSYFLTDARFSPSGRKVLVTEVTGSRGERTIHVYDLTGELSVDVPIPDAQTLGSAPEWLDEETLVLVTSDGAGRTRSWSVSVKEGGK